MNRYSRQELLVAIILFCYPVLLLTLKGGVNASFFVLLAISLFALARDRSSVPPRFDATARIFAIAMASNIVAIFLSQAANSNFDPHPYDAASRFLLAIPVYLMLRHTNPRVTTVMQYSLPLGAIFTLAFSLVTYKGGRLSAYFIDPIHFGDLALMLGFLSTFSINWNGQDRLRLLLLKLSGLVAGVIASILSGSRGGWLAIPVLLFTFIFFRGKGKLKNQLLAVSAAMFAAALASYFFVDAIHQRTGEVLNDIASWSHGEMDTSFGIRLQLWKAALLLFWQHPLFGVGPNGFVEMMTPLSQTGFITPLAAKLGRGEVHSDILGSLARLGIFGLLSLLTIYLAPLFIFLKAVKSTAPYKSGAARMGVCLVLGFIVFGLTVETINMKMVAAFYGLTVAVLLGAATSSHQENAKT